ncbi:MAG: amidohydrolase family protein, partial [Methanoculleaceae archaeon]
NSVMWSIGLELALMVKNPWQCCLTTDNPNGAPFSRYPEIIALLMSKRYRESELQNTHRKTENRVSLPALDRELGWEEIAVMTRAAQARALGLVDLGKGHLSVGADADIAIYPIRVGDTDPERSPDTIIRAFSKTACTIKRGRVVARDGICVVDGKNAVIWVDPKIPEDRRVDSDPEFARLFERYYTVRMGNYPVEDAYLHRHFRIETEADL